MIGRWLKRRRTLRQVQDLLYMHGFYRCDHDPVLRQEVWARTLRSERVVVSMHDDGMVESMYTQGRSVALQLMYGTADLSTFLEGRRA